MHALIHGFNMVRSESNPAPKVEQLVEAQSRKPIWHEPYTEPETVRRALDHLDSLVPDARPRFTLIPFWLILTLLTGIFVVFWVGLIGWVIWRGTDPW